MDSKLREWIVPHDLAMIISNAGVYYGFPAAFTPNSGTQDVFFNVQLTDDRQHSSQYYAKLIRGRLQKEFPGTDFGFELGGLLTSALNQGLRSPIDVQIEGPNLETSHEAAEKLLPQIKNIPGAVDVRIQQRMDAPALRLDVDRKKAGQMGLQVDDVVKNIVSAINGSATFNPTIWVDPKTGIDYFLGVQFPENSIQDLNALLDIPIRGPHQERSVPLRDIAKVTTTKVPTEINHVNLHSVVDIFLDAQDRDIGGLSNDVQKLIDTTPMPENTAAYIRGEITEMKRSVSALGGGFVLSAILVYLILVVQFRSFVTPAIMMVSVPLGLVGVVIMLVLTHTYFSIQAAIGAIFMIGIAVANGVLLIEFIQHHLKHQTSVRAAIINGSCARLRPILMTSMASVLGLVPMAIGVGHGSEANIPLGRAVIGGQLLSTALTLFVVPILFELTTKVAVDTIQTPIPGGDL